MAITNCSRVRPFSTLEIVKNYFNGGKPKDLVSVAVENDILSKQMTLRKVCHVKNL